MANPFDAVKETATRLMAGILSNPNYNFDGAKKAADIAVNHAKTLLVKVGAITVEESARIAGDVADKIETAAREVREGVEAGEQPAPVEPSPAPIGELPGEPLPPTEPEKDPLEQL